MTQGYERAKQVARSVLSSKSLSVEERRVMQDLKNLNEDEIMYVIAWLKGVILASNIVADFQDEMK